MERKLWEVMTTNLEMVGNIEAEAAKKTAWTGSDLIPATRVVARSPKRY